MHNWLISKDDLTKYFVRIRIPDMFSLNVIYLLGGGAKLQWAWGRTAPHFAC